MKDSYLETEECPYTYLSEFCSLFSNSTRLKILYALKDEEKTVGALAEIVDCPIQNISQHLRLMKDRSCLVARKEGKNVYYRISSNSILKGLEIVRKSLCNIAREKKQF